MKIVKGNFNEKNKGTGNKNQSFERQGPRSSGIDELPYSAMFRDLIKPYMNKAHGTFDLERVVQIGILAWNLTISKSMNLPGFKQLFNSTMKEAGFDKDESEVIKKIMKTSQEKYPDNVFFIENYELKEDKSGIPEISIGGKSIYDLPEIEEDEDFDDEDFDDEDFDDEDFDDMQFEQGIVNRSAFSLKYKAAFVEFIKQNNSFSDLLGLKDSTIYLIEEKDTHEEATKWLKKNFEKIMVNELEDVTFDEAKWPRRTYKVFCDLFEIQFHDMVMDLENEPVIKV